MRDEAARSIRSLQPRARSSFASFSPPAAASSIDTSSGYYLSSDHSMLLILTKPRKPAQDVPFGKAAARRGVAHRGASADRLSEDRAAGNAAAEGPAHRRIRDRRRRRGPHPPRRHRQHPRHRSSACWRCSSTPSAGRLRSIYAGMPLALGLLLTFGMAGADLRRALAGQRRIRRAAGRAGHRLHHRPLRPLRRRAESRHVDARTPSARSCARRCPASSSPRSPPRERSSPSWPPTSAG